MKEITLVPSPVMWLIVKGKPLPYSAGKTRRVSRMEVLSLVTPRCSDRVRGAFVIRSLEPFFVWNIRQSGRRLSVPETACWVSQLEVCVAVGSLRCGATPADDAR